MNVSLTLIFLLLSTLSSLCQSIVGNGQQPQVSVDVAGTIRMIYGDGDKIYYTTSRDKGSSFSSPVVISEIKNMHLGMGRAPQIASSKDYSIVTAIDEPGNIHSFRLNHKSGKWTKLGNVNDVPEIAKEGMINIAADDANNFYAVWLDLRADHNNKIAFATLAGAGTWSANRIIYTSPDKTVCECCRPSIAVRKNNVAIMFRNWVNGSRDLYLTLSTNKGKTFEKAQKLGTGTWKLRGCPMDGGGISIDASNGIHTVWQRDGNVFYVQPGDTETKVSEGRGCTIAVNSSDIIGFERGAQLVVQAGNAKPLVLGEGTALDILELQNKSRIAVWERDKQIVYRKF